MKRSKKLFNKNNSYSSSKNRVKLLTSKRKGIKQTINMKVKSNKKRKMNNNKRINRKYNLKKGLTKFVFLIILFIINISIDQVPGPRQTTFTPTKIISKKKRVALINLYNLQNVGNILIKFS